MRRTDFARLDDGGHTYLDYTGGGLFAASQLREHVALLQGTVLGNPHSINPTSSVSTELVERARAAVLRFFNASEDEYVAIFTPNATGALRLVGEAYPFRAGDRFLLTFDNHNSVNGIREFARARGAETTYVPSVAPDLRVDEELLPRYGEFGDGMTLDDYMDVIGLPTGGAVRASLGLASNFADVDRFFDFASEFIDLTTTPDDLPARTAC